MYTTIVFTPRGGVCPAWDKNRGSAYRTAMAYQLVIFDMDGTLTEERLDFAAIRRELGLAPGVGILEYISHLPPAEAPAAQAILDRHEMAAADACEVHDGAAEVLAQLAARRLHTALLTRNSAACAQRILTRHRLRLDHVATREDLPHKPHADSILNIARRFGVSPRQTLMVGDYLYDVEAAHNAGADMALLCARYGATLPNFAAQATYRIRRLHDVLTLVDARADRGVNR